MAKVLFSDHLIENGFRENGFNLQPGFGRVCQLHLKRRTGVFRPLKTDLQSIESFWVPVRNVIRPGSSFYFHESLRTLQWKKMKGLAGSFIELGIAALYSLSDRHQTGIMLQSWLNPSPTLKALHEVDFTKPFIIYYVDDIAAQVEIFWYSELWKLELSAFAFTDLFLVESGE